MQDRYDIIISGAGLAGLVAATAFGQARFSVLCVDPMPQVADCDECDADLRSTAFLQPAQAFLALLGVWEQVASDAMPLQVMQIIDDGGKTEASRLDRSFKADEISSLPFGWNVPNYLLRRKLLAHLDKLPDVELRQGIASTKLFTRLKEARVSFSDNTTAHAKLVIAADGPHSTMRQAAGITTHVTRYGQKALTFAVTHPQPHANVSSEIYRSGGPFTLVPLPDYQGQPSSAVVWMETSAKANALQQLPVETFEAAMTARSCSVLGPLKLTSNRSLWPIISQTATRLYSERLALIAEAAHVMPPIGAQGLNSSLKDVAVLFQLAKAKPDTLGNADMLKLYHRARFFDIRARAFGISALNRASMVSAQPLCEARAVVLHALHGFAPLRKRVMQIGLGLPKS